MEMSICNSKCWFFVCLLLGLVYSAEEIYVQEGSIVELKCPLQIEPKSVTWIGPPNSFLYAVGNEVAIGIPFIAIKSLDFMSALVINNFTQDKEGRYECYKDKTTRNEFDIWIQRAPTIFVIFEQTSPKKRTLRCIADGVPKNFTFYDWKHKTEFYEHLRDLQDIGNGSINIPDIPGETDRHHDRGIYICTVSNGVIVDGKLTVSAEYHLQANGSPYFVTSNNNVLFGHFKSNVQILVHVISIPHFSQVTVFNSTSKLINYPGSDGSSNNVIDTVYGKNISVMVISLSHNVMVNNVADFQQYTIEVINEFGASNYTVHLEPAKILINVEALPSSTISEGDSLTLICRYGSVPEPTRVTWKFDNSILLGKGHLYEYNSIHFPSIQRQQSGNYSCEIDNVLGKANNTIYVSIEKKETQSEVIPYSIMTLVLIMAAVGVGILLCFLACWYLIKGLKKQIRITKKQDRELPQQQDLSQADSESHYEEIESAYYCPVQISGTNVIAVHVELPQPLVSADEIRDVSVPDRKAFNDGKTMCVEANDIVQSSSSSDRKSNSSKSTQKSDDSYLVPSTSFNERMSGGNHMFILPATSACDVDESSVSSNNGSLVSSSNSETLLKSDQRYESLNSVNIIEHPYLRCYQLDTNVHLSENQ